MIFFTTVKKTFYFCINECAFSNIFFYKPLKTEKKYQEKQKVNEQFLETLFKKYFSSLCIFARQYVYDNDKVKDIVHDVFINIWEKGELYASDSLIKGYLFTSVKNRCFNYLRDNKKFHEDIDTLSYSLQSPGAEDKTEYTELELVIKEAIDSLPVRCQEIFILSRYEMLKYQEIADKLGISVKTVEAQMSKALKIMREHLSDYTELILIILILTYLAQG